eukprot:m.132360 g.132360  ORF g.132360 m.132360 type:complete len:76 (+) comp52382_c0_seq1:41-268(+)
MLSDLILFGTLLVNAGAVLNFKLGEKQLPVEFALPTAEETSSDKIRNIIKQLRHLRVFIAIWNLIVIVLMLVLFS